MSIETPSARIIAKANEIKETKDEDGHIIHYRDLKPSDQIELYSMLGTEKGGNFYVYNALSSVYRIVDIDGIAMPPMTSYALLKAALDHAGVKVIQAMYKADTPEDDEEEKTEDEPAKEKTPKKT